VKEKGMKRNAREARMQNAALLQHCCKKNLATAPLNSVLFQVGKRKGEKEKNPLR